MSHSSGSEHHSVFRRFVHSEVSGSVVLLLCSVTALVWANSSWADSYFGLIQTYVGISWGDATFELSLQHWVNDALMVLFFFVVGLEVKREIVIGELSSMRQAALPLAAALGGMIVPALFYLALNFGGEGARGWGIPMATDIAFALGILALFGSRVPLGLKIFLTALAIADDIGAVLVIALVYTEQIRWLPLGVAALFMLAIAAIARKGVRSGTVYLPFAIGVWAAVLASGVHATVAGILVAMLVPVRARIDPSEFLKRTRKRLSELEDQELSRQSMLFETSQREAIEDLYVSSADMRPAGVTLEDLLHPVQAFLVLPLFALFNAGVVVTSGLGESLGQPITLGVVAGLLVGKPVGVFLFSWVTVRSGRASLPDGVGWGQIAGAGLLAGVGFTMSLFVSDLAFASDELVGVAKIGILVASLASGIGGFLLLQRLLPPKSSSENQR